MSKRAILSEVGEHLVRLRTERGLDTDSAAAAARIDVERLAAAEAGDGPLSTGELDRLAEVYGVNVTAFFGGRMTRLQDYA